MEPERRKEMTRKVIKKISAVPKSPIKARDATKKADRKIQVPPAKELIQGGRAHIDIADLYKLGGLEGEAGKLQPVSCAQYGVAEEDVDQHQQDGDDRHGGAGCHGALQLPQPETEQKEQRHGGDGQHDLLEQIVRRGGGGHRKPEAGQIKGQRFDFKAGAVDKAHGVIAGPLQRDQRDKGQRNGFELVGSGRQGVLTEETELEHGQLQEGSGGGDAAADGGALGLQLFALFRLKLPKTKPLSADIDHIPALNGQAGGAGLGGLDPDAASGKDVVDPPASPVAPAEDRVYAADARVDETYIRAQRAADDVLPMREGEGVLPVAEIAPGLGLIVLGEHGADAADDQCDRQQDQDILAHGERIVGQPFHQDTSSRNFLHSILFYHKPARIDKHSRVN